AQEDGARLEPELRAVDDRLLRLVQPDEVEAAGGAEVVARAQPVDRGRRELEGGLLFPRRLDGGIGPRGEEELRVGERDGAEGIIDRVGDPGPQRASADGESFAPLADPERTEIEGGGRPLDLDAVAEVEPEARAPLPQDGVGLLVDREVRV